MYLLCSMSGVYSFKAAQESLGICVQLFLGHVLYVNVKPQMVWFVIGAMLLCCFKLLMFKALVLQATFMQMDPCPW